MVLLIGAGLMIRSFAQMTRVDRGFQPEHLLTAKLDFSISGFTTWVRPTETRPQVSLRELMERLKNQPGVHSVATAGDKAGFRITVENRQTGAEDDYPRVSLQGVSPDYFRAMGIPVLRGRAFTESDELESPGSRSFPNPWRNGVSPTRTPSASGFTRGGLILARRESLIGGRRYRCGQRLSA